jgi:hypothetical protein
VNIDTGRVTVQTRGVRVQAREKGRKQETWSKRAVRVATQKKKKKAFRLAIDVFFWDFSWAIMKFMTLKPILCRNTYHCNIEGSSWGRV